LIGQLASVNVTVDGIFVVFQYFVCFILFPLTILLHICKETIRINALLLSFVAGVLFLNIDAHVNYFFDFSLLSDGFRVKPRFESLAGNPNVFGSILCINLVILYTLAVQGSLSRYTTLLLGCLSFSSITLTASVTSSLLGFLILLSLLWLVIKRNILIFGALLSIILLLIQFWNVKYIGPSQFVARVVDPIISFETFASHKVREGLVLDALSIISQHLPFGVGAGNYLTVSSSIWKVHNTFLLLLAEGGVIALVGIYLVVYNLAAKLVNYSVYDVTLMTFVLASLVLLTLCLTSTHLYGRFLLPIILLLYLADTVPIMRSGENSSGGRKSPMKPE
jgi:O-antigen ligase